MLNHIHEKLVVDWRTRAEARADMRVAIRGALDNGLPEDPYPRDVFDQKVQAIFDHVISSYPSQSENVYADQAVATSAGAAVATLTMDAESVIAQLRHDEGLARRVQYMLREQEVHSRTLAERTGCFSAAATIPPSRSETTSKSHSTSTSPIVGLREMESHTPNGEVYVYRHTPDGGVYVCVHTPGWGVRGNFVKTP